MLDGVIYPKDKMHAPIAVTFMGVAYDPTLSIGGGPMPVPPTIWGPPGPWPTPPIHLGPGGEPLPPGIWGPTDPRPTPPIYLPVPVPPGPNVPPPGSPPAIVEGTTPVNPIVPPGAILIEYPGIGKVLVPQPTATVAPPPLPQPQPPEGTPAPPQAGQLPSTPIATPTKK